MDGILNFFWYCHCCFCVVVVVTVVVAVVVVDDVVLLVSILNLIIILIIYVCELQSESAEVWYSFIDIYMIIFMAERTHTGPPARY